METIVLEDGYIQLPKRVVNMFRGKRVLIEETTDGVLLKPGADIIKGTRGILKGSRFNSKTFAEQKQRDKDCEK